ncbi:MAG TPA: glycosyltransferase family 39 protein [bacterium]|nr:glycosyltransferase family 39 protein [bacterium]
MPRILQSPRTSLLFFILVLAVLRLAIIGGIPISPDEAYYFAWSRRLAVCYYDQPGMVAWVDWLFGLPWAHATVFTLRLAAVVLSALSTWVLYRAYRDYRDDEREAAVFAMVFSLLPFTWLTGIIMIHDTVFLPWLALTYWAIVRLAKHDGRPRDWLFLSLAITGAMYAKFSAVMIGWGLALYMLWSPRGRRWWKTWHPYAAGALTGALYLPVVIWNARHGWISLRAVQELTTRTHITPADRLGWVIEYMGSQIGIFSGLLGIVVFAALLKGVRDAWKRPADDRVVLPVCLALPVFLYFLQQSFKSPVFGNWPGVAYVPASMLAMSEVSRLFREGGAGAGKSNFTRRFIIAGLALDLALIFLFTVQLRTRAFRPALAGLEKALGLTERIDWRLDADFAGWDEMAALTEQERPRADFILTRRYQIAGVLEFMLPDQPEVECYNQGQRGNQWDLWPGLSRDTGRTALYVDIKRMPREVRARCGSVEPIHAPLVLGDPERPVKTIYMYLCRGWKGPERAVTDSALHGTGN